MLYTTFSVCSMLDAEKVTVYRATQIFRQFLYGYRDQLSASVLVAGWDEQEGGQVRLFFSHFPLNFWSLELTSQHLSNSSSGVFLSHSHK